MNNKSAAENSAATGSQAVDETQLKEAMQRLKLLHIKSRLLRDTIPRMIEPLVQKQPSPDAMFSSFVKAATDAQTEVKEFADLMRDEESKKALAMADKSREENPFGIKPWAHKDHPDWFDMDKN